MHLIQAGAEHCFSELKFLQFKINSNNLNVLEGLARICKSVKTLECYIIGNLSNNVSGIVKLIEAQKNLNDIRFIDVRDDQFHKTLEESLIKHADTVQCLQISWIPITKILPYLVNLISLDINLTYMSSDNLKLLNWSHLKNAPLPCLKILKAQWVPSKILASLIENTKGQLAEISIIYAYAHDSQRIIQSIYQNCPNLIYCISDFV